MIRKAASVFEAVFFYKIKVQYPTEVRYDVQNLFIYCKKTGCHFWQPVYLLC